MADDWEDWETAPVATAPPPPVPAVPASGSKLAEGIDMSQFADEEAALVVEEAKHNVPASQPKKKEEKKYERNTLPVDTPLDDPVAEKLRRQRLEEQADYAAARELFGDAGAGINLEVFLPKSLKDFEDYAHAIAGRYVVGHRESKNYKAFVKALVKAACAPLTSAETKDIETSVAGVRTEKFKAEQAEAAAKKGTRKQLNVGKTGGTAGLDDYIYDDAGQGDDFDFM